MVAVAAHTSSHSEADSLVLVGSMVVAVAGRRIVVVVGGERGRARSRRELGSSRRRRRGRGRGIGGRRGGRKGVGSPIS